ncbi:amino acid ABC transporter permease [Corynebacterium sp. MC-04]|uniref:Amino acid ABC transporter permease n=1 Tax=Corynebacterium parakroppenstedtii TaxID=2828363 RepID=A0ABS9HHN3_9CORY|nr:amino acid ABC transporter permease [Corynebacterium parakroppenstedtii]KXB51362.1 ABC transporter, permease protein [Corynebacterium kroppenstedtii]MCZ9302883.1 amino acid ABC transporter permease [Corynebacterium sp. c24U_166]MBY0787844.1 amino acid ABC transporter permease [Corynebacterium parakroppenstedtii]MBY0791920.1 amino acid ABC transporter permease [Corynebacterium parakroppenstedtii]MCF6768870.1 amino acid ABC transporter permease [Corynebacterium parakroppenstedtii]
MSTRATVLYDNPGPRGRQINRILTAVTVVVAALVIGWTISVLAKNGQLEASKWDPFIKSTTWKTYILPGLWGTLKAAFVSIILAMLLGAVLGTGRLHHRWIVRRVCGVIVEFFRAIPVLILMIFAYQLFAEYAVFPSEQLAFAAVVFGLTLYNGAVIAEVLRSGIEALPSGQSEAALALGLTHRQTMRIILLPQAVASMLPALIAQMVIALKDSALGYQIGYVEVVRSGIQSASYYRNFLAALVVVAVIMIIVNIGLTKFAERIELQLRAGRARRNIVAHVPHQKEQGVETKDEAVVDWHDPAHRDLRSTFE